MVVSYCKRKLSGFGRGSRMILILLVLLLFYGSSAYSATTDPLSASQPYRYTDMIHIPAGLGEGGQPVTIEANLFVPKSSDQRQRYPVIIFPNSWGMTQYEYRAPAMRFANHGYVVLSYSARGWGQSTGLVDEGGPRDMEDIHAIVDWLIRHAPVDPHRIGMAGISYGAGLSLLGAAHDARIRAVAAMSGWSNLYHSLYLNQTAAVMTAKLLQRSAQLVRAHLSPETVRYFSLLKGYHVAPSLKAWALERSPITYVKRFNERSPAIYLSNNFQDSIFNAADMLDFYNQLSVRHKQLDLNQGGHAAAEASALHAQPNYVWDQVMVFFDRYLKSGARHVVPTASLSMQGAQSLTHETIVPASMQQQSYYLGPALPAQRQNQKQGVYGLSLTPPVLREARPMPATRLSQGRSVLTSGTSRWVLIELYKLKQSFKENILKPVIAPLSKLNAQYAALYVSAPVQKAPLLIRGTLQLDLNVAVHPVNLARRSGWRQWLGWGRRAQHTAGPVPVAAQLIAYLYDVDKQRQTARLITYAPMTFYKRQITLDQPFHVAFPLRLAADDIPVGHCLGLGLGTKDALYRSPASNWHGYILELLPSGQAPDGTPYAQSRLTLTRDAHSG